MNIQRVNYRSTSSAKDFAQSLKETGFGVITHHPIDVQLIETVYADWKNFFQSNEIDKLKYLHEKETQAGYFPFRSENAKTSPIKDLKEFFHIYRWSGYPKTLGPATNKLFDEMMKLGRTLLQWIDEQAPESIRREFSMPLQNMSEDSPQNLLRIIHYPPMTGTEEAGAVRAAAHEDINLITLLPASTHSGLQVLDARGNWHSVASNWGEIVVNVGDMLQEASQGYYRSTTHRVVNPLGDASKNSRYSMPLFTHPRPDVRLSTKHTAESYLQERLREIGLK